MNSKKKLKIYVDGRFIEEVDHAGWCRFIGCPQAKDPGTDYCIFHGRSISRRIQKLQKGIKELREKAFKHRNRKTGR